MLRCLVIYNPILWKIDIDYIIWKIKWIYENRILTFNFCRNSMKSHTSEYYIGYWVVSSDLCFCKDLKNTSRLQKIWILDPVNSKSKSPLCACRPCINLKVQAMTIHITSTVLVCFLDSRYGVLTVKTSWYTLCIVCKHTYITFQI